MSSISLWLAALPANGRNAAVADTMPPADDRLYGPDRFSSGWLVLAIVALVLAFGGLVWALRPPRRPRIAAEAPQLLGLRDRYLRRVDELGRQVAEGELGSRQLHHELSRTLRSFASELGTVTATSMSASALEDAGQTAIAAAIRRYEHPQFEERPEADPVTSLGIARAVVTRAVDRPVPTEVSAP